MDLKEIGWNGFFEKPFRALQDQGLGPARVIREEKSNYLVLSEKREHRAVLSGKFRFKARARADFPVVGDWVAVDIKDQAIIQAVLPRKSKFSRKVAGETTEEQIVAANIDTVFLVSSLEGGRNFNARGIERYLALAWESGAQPVIILNKIDLCPQFDTFVKEAESVALGVPIHPVSALQKEGIVALDQYLKSGSTTALLGPSGVGKSALINCLLGTEKFKTGAIREDDKRGRHTTTHRELVFLPQGGALIDNPGMREIQLWGDEESLQGAFEDIEELARECRFNDCQHLSEPGCAIQEALAQGVLESKRYENYLQLQKELRYLERRQDQKAKQEQKEKSKQLARRIKQMKKIKKDKLGLE